MTSILPDAAPPRRSTHLWGPGWVHDRWGGAGRPVLLLHSLLFDRRVWWPVAADLAPHCTVIGPDLPGHGDSPACDDTSPGGLARRLAVLLLDLDLRRAPVVVGHGTSARIAAAFAAAFATHATVTVDGMGVQLGPARRIELTGGEIPPAYAPWATPADDPALLRRYRTGWDGSPSRMPAEVAQLEVVSRQPRADEPVTAVGLPQLARPEPLAALLRTLL